MKTAKIIKIQKNQRTIKNQDGSHKHAALPIKHRKKSWNETSIIIVNKSQMQNPIQETTPKLMRGPTTLEQRGSDELKLDNDALVTFADKSRTRNPIQDTTPILTSGPSTQKQRESDGIKLDNENLVIFANKLEPRNRIQETRTDEKQSNSANLELGKEPAKPEQRELAEQELDSETPVILTNKSKNAKSDMENDGSNRQPRE